MITGRTSAITDDLKEKFRQFSLDTGILEEHIAILPPNGTVLRFESIIKSLSVIIHNI